jgi:hypothetical protein
VLRYTSNACLVEKKVPLGGGRDTRLSALIIHFGASGFGKCSFSRVFMKGGRDVNFLSCANKTAVPFPLSYCRPSTVGAKMLLNLLCSTTENFHTRPDRLWGLHSLLYDGYRLSFSGVKRPGGGVKHPPQSSAKNKVRI